MRQIESKMNQAIQQDSNWSSGNTMVTQIDGVSWVHLHGNLIAKLGDGFIQLFDGGWQSNTTKSRLNALLDNFGRTGERVFQKDFKWFVGMSDGSPIDFRSGMTLN